MNNKLMAFIGLITISPIFCLNLELSVNSLNIKLANPVKLEQTIFTVNNQIFVTVNSEASSWDIVAYSSDISGNTGFINASRNATLPLKITSSITVLNPQTISYQHMKDIADEASTNKIIIFSKTGQNYIGPLYLYFGSDLSLARPGYHGAYINLRIIEHYLGWIDNFNDFDKQSLLGGYWASFPPTGTFATLNIVTAGLNNTDGAISFNYNVATDGISGFTVDFSPSVNVSADYKGVSFYAKGVNTLTNLKVGLKNNAVLDFNYHSKSIFVSNNETKYDLYFDDFVQGQWDNSPIINISNTLQNLSGLQFQIANGSGTVEFDEIKFHSLLRNYVLVDDFEDNDLFDNFVRKNVVDNGVITQYPATKDNVENITQLSTVPDMINSAYMLSFFSPNSGANGTEGVISIPVPTSNLNNADYKGIEFKIKGTNGNKVRVEVENNPNAEGYNFYGIQFDLTTAWSTKTFTFANDFSQELYWGTPVDKAVGLNNVVKIRFKIQSPLTIFYLDDIKLIK